MARHQFSWGRDNPLLAKRGFLSPKPPLFPSTPLSQFYKSAPSVYSRTALGRYPLAVGSSFSISGWNLGDNPSVSLGSTNLDPAPGARSFSIPETAASGSLSVSVNGIYASNNRNCNDAGLPSLDASPALGYNRQPNNVNNDTLNDDILIDVWEFKAAAKPVNGPILQPHMKVGPDGQLGFSYDNATLYFNMPGQASDGKTYGQTVFGRNFGGFTSNAFTYDSSSRTFGVALCPDTSGQAGMSANLQFFSGKSALVGYEVGGDLNGSYKNQPYARRIENTSIKLDGATIMQNINRVQSPSMAAYRENNTSYVYVAYYDELSKQVRFRVGSVASSSRNAIGMGLVDLEGSSVTGRVGGSGEDDGKLSASTTRDSISGYVPSAEPIRMTENIADITDKIIFKVPSKLISPAHIHYYKTSSGISTSTPVPMAKVDDYFTYVLPNTTLCSVIFTYGTTFENQTGNSDNIRVTAGGVYELKATGESTGWVEKLTSGTIDYMLPSNTMPSYDGYGYCHVVAANGVSGGTEEYRSATPRGAGQYVAVGSLNDGTAVIAWYDSAAGRLAFSWMGKNDVLAAKQSLAAGTDIWQSHAYYASDESIRAGTHVSMAVDASNGVHLAYYSASGGDLWYSYIENPTSQTEATSCVMVDSYGSVGTYAMIDVARDSSDGPYVPYISFRCESNAETSASVKIAYPVAWNSANRVYAGVGTADDYSGYWEISIVPTGNTPITDYTSVGVNKNWDDGVRKAFEKGNGASASWSAVFAVGNSTTVYGNGTMNPIVSYAVSENYALEIGQKL